MNLVEFLRKKGEELDLCNQYNDPELFTETGMYYAAAAALEKAEELADTVGEILSRVEQPFSAGVDSYVKSLEQRCAVLEKLTERLAAFRAATEGQSDAK